MYRDCLGGCYSSGRSHTAGKSQSYHQKNKMKNKRLHTYISITATETRPQALKTGNYSTNNKNLSLASICNCSAVVQMRTSRLDNYSNALFSCLIVRRGKRRLRGVLLNSYENY